MFRYAHEHNLPVLIHTWDGKDPGSPWKCAEAAAKWPNAKVILGHTGGSKVGRRECEEIAQDPRYSTPEARSKNKTEYYKIFSDAFRSQPLSHWLSVAEQLDLPIVRMNHFSDVAEDEQAWVNGYLEHVEFANGRVDVMPSSPIEMDSIGTLKTTPAPEVGADTTEILQFLGYSNEEITRLQETGAIK
jgi:crotonobetainyl-CoA:carnitine CoA-transferase CaiB-like acyl-CoA transferase